MLIGFGTPDDELPGITIKPRREVRIAIIFSFLSYGYLRVARCGGAFCDVNCDR